MSSDVDFFLAHYGVKGMRWGVRKDRSSFPKERKTLTSDQKKLLKKVAIGTAFVAALGVTVYGAYQGKKFSDTKSSINRLVSEPSAKKILKDYGNDSDQIFRSGTEFSRFSKNVERSMDRGRAYVFTDPSDRSILSGFGANEIKITALKDLRAPSTKTSVDMLISGRSTQQLYSSRELKLALGSKLALKVTNKEKLGAIAFSRINHDRYQSDEAKNFVKDLLSRGYSVINDTNYFSDDGPKSAKILLDATSVIYN